MGETGLGSRATHHRPACPADGADTLKLTRQPLFLALVAAAVLIGSLVFLKTGPGPRRGGSEALERAASRHDATPSVEVLDGVSLAGDGESERRLRSAPDAPTSRAALGRVSVHPEMALLRVEVKDKGRAVPGARVELPEEASARCLSAAADALDPWVGVTDGEGLVSFEVDPLRQVDVAVLLPGEGQSVRYSRRVSTPAMGGKKTVRFRVLFHEPETVVHLKVISSVGGRALAGAKVRLLGSWGGPRIELETDRDGAATFPLAQGQRIIVKADGHCTRELPWRRVHQQDRVLVELVPHASVQGRVTLGSDCFPAELLLSIGAETESGFMGSGAPRSEPGAGMVYAELSEPGPWRIESLNIPTDARSMDVGVALRTPHGVIELGRAEGLRPGENRDLGNPWAGVHFARSILRYPSGALTRSEVQIDVATPAGATLALRGGAKGEPMFVPSAGAELRVQGQRLPGPKSGPGQFDILELTGLGVLAGSVSGPGRGSAEVILLTGLTKRVTTRVKDGRFHFDLVPLGTSGKLAAYRRGTIPGLVLADSEGVGPVVTAPAGDADVQLELPAH